LARQYPDDQWLVGYGPSVEATWLAVWDDAVRAGEVRTGRIGEAVCHLFRARAVIERYAARLRANPYAAFGL